jgi:hypothetical protein
MQTATSGPAGQKGFIDANADKHRQTDGIKHRQDPFRQPARLADQQDGQHAGDHRHHQIGGIFDPEYRAIRQRHIADGPAATASPRLTPARRRVHAQFSGQQYAGDSKNGCANNIQPIDKHR